MPQELPLTVANFSARLTERGRDAMTLLRVPESCSWQNCSSWCFPTSIVVAGVSYRVESDVFREEYVVYPLNGNTPVARGILMCRNLNLDVHGPSNHVDFAVGVMNAGLKELERCAIEPRTVMRWNPTSAELGQWYFGRPRQPNTP